jgi:hypothetical protein
MQRSWNVCKMWLLPYTGWLFVSRKASPLLHYPRSIEMLGWRRSDKEEVCHPGAI